MRGSQPCFLSVVPKLQQDIAWLGKEKEDLESQLVASSSIERLNVEQVDDNVAALQCNIVDEVDVGRNGVRKWSDGNCLDYMNKLQLQLRATREEKETFMD